MPLVIRDYETGLFFVQGKWTTDVRLAENFGGGDAIRKAIAEHQIIHAEMAILDHKNRYITGVPIDSGGIKNGALE
jgi:hypothetical protein